MESAVFGERLRALRKQAKMTQQAVADKLNIHRSTYTKYETDNVTPDHQGLVILSRLFGVSVDYLVGRTDEAYAVASSVENDMLSPQEWLLVQKFRQLPAEEQEKLMQDVQTTLRDKK